MKIFSKRAREKQMKDDAVVIYKCGRLPERKVFYIDVGDMPLKDAREYVDRIAKELNPNYKKPGPILSFLNAWSLTV